VFRQLSRLLAQGIEPIHVQREFLLDQIDRAIDFGWRYLVANDQSSFTFTFDENVKETTCFSDPERKTPWKEGATMDKFWIAVPTRAAFFWNERRDKNNKYLRYEYNCDKNRVMHRWFLGSTELFDPANMYTGKAFHDLAVTAKIPDETWYAAMRQLADIAGKAAAEYPGQPWRAAVKQFVADKAADKATDKAADKVADKVADKAVSVPEVQYTAAAYRTVIQPFSSRSIHTALRRDGVAASRLEHLYHDDLVELAIQVMSKKRSPLEAEHHLKQAEIHENHQAQLRAALGDDEHGA
jgi:hypothetical protein